MLGATAGFGHNRSFASYAQGSRQLYETYGCSDLAANTSPFHRPMNTLQSHTTEYKQGLVSKLSFSALDDAEGYGAASSISACSESLAHLWEAISYGQTLKLFRPDGEPLVTTSKTDFHAWCIKYFRVSYDEYLRRKEP